MFDRINNKLDYSERIERQCKKQKEYKLLGSTRKVKGLKLYSYNMETGEIKIADVVRCDTIDLWTQQPIVPDKVVIEKGCIYHQALNIKNARKHFEREGFHHFSN